MRVRVSLSACFISGTEIVSSYVSLSWPQFASSASLNQPPPDALGDACQRCPLCTAALCPRSQLGGGFTEAAAGYHCDGCGAADPHYRCPSATCDWDLCAACFSGFVGRGEHLLGEYGFRCDCERCELEREEEATATTEFREEDLGSEGGPAASLARRAKRIEEFLFRFCCASKDCEDGVMVPRLGQPHVLECNRCGGGGAAKGGAAARKRKPPK